MFNNFFLLDFTNKTERIDCEYFHLDTFAYQPQKEYKYTKVFTISIAFYPRILSPGYSKRTFIKQTK